MSPTAPIRPDNEKLRELILFIAMRSANDSRFGSTKLNKLLFFADFLAYVRLGRPITGHVYQKLDNGPAPRAMVPIMRQMEQDAVLAIQTRDHYGKVQKVPIALRDAKLDRFTPEEVALMGDVLDAFRSKNAKDISDLSHQFAGWQLASDGEDIPYQVALVQLEKPSQKDVARAIAISDELTALARECRGTDAH